MENCQNNSDLMISASVSDSFLAQADAVGTFPTRILSTFPHVSCIKSMNLCLGLMSFLVLENVQQLIKLVDPTF